MASNYNRQLRRLYVKHWPTLRDLMLEDSSLSTPYLAQAWEGYESARIRLVIVGKETNGWVDREPVLSEGAEGAVDLLMSEYRKFKLGLAYKGRASFWTPAHELYRRINPDGPEMGFVCLNASKMDSKSRMPKKSVMEAQVRTGLLLDELNILNPHVVIFHTGPTYDYWLKQWIPDLLLMGDAWLAHAQSVGLPDKSWRTYHPRYLNYMGRRAEIYDQIIGSLERTARIVKKTLKRLQKSDEY